MPVDDCGSGTGVDCREVVEQVYLYLDGELDSDRLTVLRGHLDQCVSCLRMYGLEEEVRALVARCCGGDRAPEHLHAKVRATITTIIIER